LDDRQAIISVNLCPLYRFCTNADETREGLNEAARTTLQRGDRYFTIVETYGDIISYDFTISERYGRKMLIYMYREGEILPAGPNVWDARSVLAAIEQGAPPPPATPQYLD
jgi:hypothetical protein